jgi:hypothetical protein
MMGGAFPEPEKPNGEAGMLYRLGRFLQLFGMITLPLAIAGQLTPNNPMDVRTMMLLTGGGVLAFGVGWLLQEAGRPR